MSLLKNKFFLPLCLSGLLVGYTASEWVIPRYIDHPAPEVKSVPQNIIKILSPQATYYRRTPSGNYLAGQFAQRHKDWEKASDFISEVREKDPDSFDLKKHSMVLSMAAGDVPRAISIAKDVAAETNDNLLAILFLALDDFQNENYTDVKKTLDKVNANSVAAFLIPVLKLWADTGNNVLDTTNFSPSSFYAYQAMLAANYLNKSSEALQSGAIQYALNAFSVGESDIRDLEKAADLFAHLGETKKATELYKTIKEKGFANEKINQKISRLQDNKDIHDLVKIRPIESPKQGAATVFFDMAEILFREYSDDSAVVFSQMALYLDPNLEESHIMIGNIQTRHERYNEAIEQYKKIKSDSDLYVTAQRQIADLYAEQKNDEKAIEILSNLYRNHEDVDALIQIGDIYRYREDYSNAVKNYNKAINLWDDVPEKYWHVLYARGMAYERMKKFKKSEKDLQKALEFRPNHPYLLNYLGYSWVDQGINLHESLDMIKKATLAKPDDGYIADSLGWAYYKMNELDSALVHLERAVELLPYDATINDHLGDAYWRTGRKLEARFQWRRAINYSEEDEIELKAKIEEKIISGLPDLSQENPKTLTGSIDQDLEEKISPSL